MATATETAPGLQFDVDRHVYTMDGRRLPSVTQILDRLSLYKGKEWWTDEARERGSAVHLALYLLAHGRLDLGSIDERIDPYIDAYVDFKKHFESIVCEEPMASRRFGYAGTPDDIGFYAGEPEITIPDYKATDAAYPVYEIQLEAYEQLAIENGWINSAARKMIVLLGKDGKFRIAKRFLTETRARTLWASALNLYQFKEIDR